MTLDSIKGGMSEFQQWVDAARNANEDIKIALKADASTPYKTVKRGIPIVWRYCGRFAAFIDR